MGDRHGRPEPHADRFAGEPVVAMACLAGDRPGCVEAPVRMMRDADRHFVVCGACGRHGPTRGSAHDALVAWRDPWMSRGWTVAQRLLVLAAMAAMAIAATGLAALLAP